MVVVLCNGGEHHAPEDQTTIKAQPRPTPWHKGKLIGAKPPIRAKHVWSIRTKLQIESRVRELAMFNQRFVPNSEI
jgi:hypothetical protein